MPIELPDLRVMPDMDGKTFLICIGAAKCGTSWLHDYLDDLPGICVSPLKELHFFTARFGALSMGDMEALAIKRVGLHMNRDGDPVETLKMSMDYQASVDRMQMIYDDNAYFAHFARLAQADTSVFCDITPGYSVLGAEGFAYMRDFFAQMNVRLKLLYILRDPVERLWSQLRHLQEINPDGEATARWADALKSPAIMARSDYAGTLDDLDFTFPTGDLHVAFYEDLFAETALRRICAFAKVAYQPGRTAARKNETKLRIAMPGAVEDALATALAGQYKACIARFGPALPASWRT